MFVQLFLLVGILGSNAEAQQTINQLNGFEASLDKVGSNPDLFRLRVRTCTPLGSAAALLRQAHGWLVSNESPVVPESERILLVMPRPVAVQCPRPVSIDVTYSRDDVVGSLQSVVDAYNAAAPPYTARLTPCGKHHCIVADQTTPVLDGLVSVSAGPKTARLLLDQVASQLAAQTGRRVDVADSFDGWEDLVVSEGFTQVPAREVIQAVSNTLSQAAFDRKWANIDRSAQLEEYHRGIRDISRAHVSQAVAAGQTSAETKVSWAAIRDALPRIVYNDPPPSPPFPVGLGPGFVWSQTVEYNVSTDPEWIILYMIPVEDPAYLIGIEHLPPGLPADFICVGDETTGDTDGDNQCDDIDPCPLDLHNDIDRDGFCESDGDCDDFDENLTPTSGCGPEEPETCDAFPCKNGKVNICHKPGEAAENTLCISENAVHAHLDHGDSCGICP